MSNVKTYVLQPYFYVIFYVLHLFYHDDTIYARPQTFAFTLWLCCKHGKKMFYDVLKDLRD